MLVGLDELADVLVPLELGPCASPTVRRLERVEVTTGHFARMLRGFRGGTNQSATRETRRMGRETLCVWTDKLQVPSTEERGSFSAVFG